MMKISVKSVHFHMDAKLVAMIDKKLSRLNKFFDHSIEAEVILKLQENGSKVQDKITEIHLLIPGGTITDKRTHKTFESALNTSVDSLKRQLVRRKEKISNHKALGLKSGE